MAAQDAPEELATRRRHAGTTIGAPDAGQGTTRHFRPNTRSTSAASTISDGRALGDDRPVTHRDQVRRVPARVVEVVQHGHQRAARRRAARRTGRAPRPGGRCRGTSSARRAAAAASPGRAPSRSTRAGAARRTTRRRAGRRARRCAVAAIASRDGALVLAATTGAAAAGAGCRPRADQIDDGDPVRRDRRLRQQPEPPRDLLGRQRRDLDAVQQHTPGLRLEHPHERAQQRRLAARVGPDDRGEAALGDVDGQPFGDDARVVGQRHRFGSQRCRAHPRRPFLHSIDNSHAR